MKNMVYYVLLGLIGLGTALQAQELPRGDYPLIKKNDGNAQGNGIESKRKVEKKDQDCNSEGTRTANGRPNRWEPPAGSKMDEWSINWANYDA